MYRNKEQEGGACIHVGGVSVSQFGLVHAIHEFLQLDRQRHVSFDLQLPWHECHRGLQFPWNNKTAASLMFPIVIYFFFFNCHGDRLPENILLKSLESIFMTTSALVGGSPCPTLPEPVFKSRNQTPVCSPYMDINKCWRHAHRISLYGHKC